MECGVVGEHYEIPYFHSDENINLETLLINGNADVLAGNA